MSIGILALIFAVIFLGLVVVSAPQDEAMKAVDTRPVRTGYSGPKEF